MRLAFAFVMILGGWSFKKSIQRGLAIRAYCGGVQAFQDDRYDDAASELAYAMSQMPGEKNFQDLHAYYMGYACLSNGNAKEAAHWFGISQDLDPESGVTWEMLLIAQRRAAFEARQYQAYFQASVLLSEMEGDTAQSFLTMAPAWACKYATTGDDSCRQEALASLAKARKAVGSQSVDWIVEGWVKQILESKTVISLADYRRSIGSFGDPDKDFG